MNEQIFDKASEYIDAIAANLGVAAEHVYTLMTKQMMVEGIVYSLVLPITLILLILVSIKSVKWTIRNWSEVDVAAETAIISCLIILGIIDMIVILLNLFLLPEYVMQIFNPEYYVIKEIMSMFGSN